MQATLCLFVFNPEFKQMKEILNGKGRGVESHPSNNKPVDFVFITVLKKTLPTSDLKLMVEYLRRAPIGQNNSLL